MLKICILSFLLSISCIKVIAQGKIPTVKIVSSGTKSSFRGLSVVSDEVIWVSGSRGTIGHSFNGGKDWKFFVVKGFEKTEFRDIEAFSATSAVIMSSGSPALILKTTDGGISWKAVYENQGKEMFLDAMEFWNEQAGIVIGDPIEGRFFIARTFDGGNSWKELPLQLRPHSDSAEACFASSGTNIRALDRDEAVFVSGGTSSHVYIRDQRFTLPFLSGPSSGANSIAVGDHDKRNGGYHLIVVGGDFVKDSVSTNNCYISNNRGKSWSTPKVPPHGYRSCVEYLARKIALSCGLTGVDYTNDNGNTWALISPQSFHVCRISKNGSEVFLAGNNGTIGKLEWDK